jgi:hypothetical protein
MCIFCTLCVVNLILLIMKSLNHLVTIWQVAKIKFKCAAQQNLQSKVWQHCTGDRSAGGGWELDR